MPRMLRLFLVWELHKKAKRRKSHTTASDTCNLRGRSWEAGGWRTASLCFLPQRLSGMPCVYSVFWRKSWHRILYKQLWKTFAAASRNISLGLWLWSFGLIVSKHRPSINIVCKDKNISDFSEAWSWCQSMVKPLKQWFLNNLKGTVVVYTKFHACTYSASPLCPIHLYTLTCCRLSFFLTLNMIDKRVGKTVRCLFFAPVSIQTSVLFLAKPLV